MKVLWAEDKQFAISLLGSGLQIGHRALAFKIGAHDPTEPYVNAVKAHAQLKLTELVHCATQRTAQMLDKGIAELKAGELRSSWAADHMQTLERAWEEVQEASLLLCKLGLHGSALAVQALVNDTSQSLQRCCMARQMPLLRDVNAAVERVDEAKQAFYAESRPPPTKRRRQEVVQRETERRESARRAVDDAQAELLRVLHELVQAAGTGMLELFTAQDEHRVLFVVDLLLEHADHFHDDSLVQNAVLDNAALRLKAEQAVGVPQRLADADVAALRLADRRFEDYDVERDLVPGRVWKVGVHADTFLIFSDRIMPMLQLVRARLYHAHVGHALGMR